jgi:hypothetical protein
MIPMTDFKKYSETTQCTGKHPFPTRNIAESTFRYGNGMKSYHCQWCGFWHVTHQDETKPSFRKGIKK